MKTFIGKLIFQIRQANNANQFDIQHRVFHAESEEEAYGHARHFGRSEEETIQQENGETIRWEFLDVAGLVELEQLEQGYQFDSQTVEVSSPELFLNYIRHIKTRKTVADMA